MTDVISRAEAKAQGLKRYFTGKPCKRGHVVERLVSGDCVECIRARTAAWYAANPERARANTAAWRAANTERHRAYAAAWRADNPERERASNAAWRAANPERKRAAVEAWTKANPDKATARWAARRARKAAAMPADWSDFDQFVMEEAGAARRRREAMTGYAWHIDHMVPLNQGGLHAWNNIQVIPASMNLAKCDKLILTTPFEWVSLLPGAIS
ncbi:endonuclease VII [Xanthomonas phage FoX2]|uniref:HNH endonuclease n=1 Tax=Xanthomonas phage FoX2 TaxID=2723898 RepID=A0A858NPD4_9CAUD|nr:endonuclease VII [Xanthomonas phage FoX2]QJB21871.1 hypothetical protein XccvBFoX2_gp52 [Xanthomonas phage FoX2]